MEPTPQKASFDEIYDQPDPRAYFTTLAPLDYLTPQHGAEIFGALLRERPAGGSAAGVLDVCCSYGVLSMLLKTDLRMSDLNAHYREYAERAVISADLLDIDRQLFATHRRPDAPSVIGLDIARNAVAHAEAAGLLDRGFVEDLESADPSPELAAACADIAMITSTGGVSYVTERTFERLLDITPRDVWVAVFCLRTHDYAPIAAKLAAYGLQTERSPRSIRQRRFADADERSWALSRVDALGLDPAGKEAEGHYHAELYLSRPAEEVAARPLDRLLPHLTGESEA